MKIGKWLLYSALLCLLVACSSSPNETGESSQANNASVLGGSTARPSSQPTRAPTRPATQAATNAPTPRSATSSPSVAPTRQPTGAAQITPTSAPAAQTVGSEILFLRGGDLIAYDVTAGTEREIAEQVRAFTATPDGRLLALVRGAGSASEVWLVNRDGSGLQQLTTNQRAEDTPVFAPDGQTLAFAAAAGDIEAGRTWGDWSRWCRESEVLLLEIATGQERSLGQGCDPAFSPDGKRVAFATAPSGVEEASLPDYPLGVGNAIRLVNRQGQNGWNFATAGDPAKPDNGRLVFAPAWSPDGRQLAYQRFVGYQALVDILYTEIGNSFEGKGKKVDLGAGWLLAPRFSPNSAQLAISDNNDSDARGWGGYEQWSVRIVRLDGQRQMALPQGPTDLSSTLVDTLPRAQEAVWSPDGKSLAVQLPPDWQPNLATNEPLFTEEKSGEVWLWQPGQPPSQKLTSNVDFASPLLWLPPVR